MKICKTILLGALMTCVTFSGVSCSTAPLSAENQVEAAQIEEVLQTFQGEGGKLNGALLVADGEKVIVSEGFGMADASLEQKNTIKTQFLIGSITKQFTAAAVLKSLYDREMDLNPDFSEEGALARIRDLLHKPLSDYLPEEDPIWEGKSPRWLNTVTLHQLLCHTSGIPNYTADPTFNDFSKIDHSALSELVALFRDKDLEFSPGSKWNYSNSGYILLGVVVEMVSGIEIGQYFEENFFEPLQMEATFMPLSGRVSDFKRGRPDLARGYAWDLFDSEMPLQEQPMYENMLHAHAAGAIISTVEDLHRWNLALYENEAVLPKFLQELMFARHMLIDAEAPNVFYAYGLAVENEPGVPLYGHHGGIPGYFTVLHYYPRSRVTLVVLQNVTGNAQQQIEIQEELQEKFGHLEANEERYQLEDAYMKEQFPAIAEQEKSYNFAQPLIDFLEEVS